jgi:hypothetical protein
LPPALVPPDVTAPPLAGRPPIAPIAPPLLVPADAALSAAFSPQLTRETRRTSAE